MILVRDIRLPLSAGEPQAFEKALHLARIPRSKAAHLGVARLSVDARQKFGTSGLRISSQPRTAYPDRYPVAASTVAVTLPAVSVTERSVRLTTALRAAAARTGAAAGSANW